MPKLAKHCVLIKSIKNARVNMPSSCMGLRSSSTNKYTTDVMGYALGMLNADTLDQSPSAAGKLGAAAAMAVSTSSKLGWNNNPVPLDSMLATLVYCSAPTI